MNRKTSNGTNRDADTAATLSFNVQFQIAARKPDCEKCLGLSQWKSDSFARANGRATDRAAGVH